MLKWFDLIVEPTIISHDIAFETTLIRKNGIVIPFRKFFIHYKKRLPKYRKFNIKARAYKYIANQIQKGILL